MYKYDRKGPKRGIALYSYNSIFEPEQEVAQIVSEQKQQIAEA